MLLLVAQVSSAQTGLPKPSSFVNDYAGIINSETKTKLERILSSFEGATKIEISVVTVPTLNGSPMDDYANELFKEWRIGKRSENNGLLVIVAPNDRKARIEVGYGLEGAINDALAGRIQDETMLPWFKNGDYSTGIFNGAIESIRILNIKYALGLNIDDINTAGLIHINNHNKRTSSPLSVIFKIIIFIIAAIVFIRNPWLFLFFLMSSGGRGSGGGFGGGGFGGFGGGLSGGGGASRSW